MPTLGASLLEAYRATPGLYDEMRDGQGQLRAQVKRFCSLVDRLGLEEFSRRWEQAQLQLDENGMAYGALRDDDSEAPRPWNLDPLPLLIPADQWQAVSVALAQRADLLNRILADLYGPQTMLAEGLLPPELLFAHEGFRRPFHGYVPPGGRYLHIYAADLARAPCGDWWVLADRTEAPSGLGHVLENRIVLSRMLPNVFHTCRIERLAPFFISLQESLGQLAGTARENLRTVLLSPGPDTHGHFEDAYLARYLGYVLVQAGDLAVRKGRVKLKTLRGLLPVDIVLRRTNSESCDALELDEAGTGGPVGLMQAVRAGNVAVANSLGAGLVESPVFQAFLPRLSEQILGTELLIPNVATWWCGQADSCKYVLQHLDRLVIRCAFRRRGDELEYNRRLSKMTPDQLRELIVAEPHQYVGQERVARSTGPVWTAKGQLAPAHIAPCALCLRGGRFLDGPAGGTGTHFD